MARNKSHILIYTLSCGHYTTWSPVTRIRNTMECFHPQCPGGNRMFIISTRPVSGETE